MKKTILVIDDQRDYADTTKMMLESLGDFEVVLADNGKDGIRAANAGRPDMIILDVMMPGMDGFEVLKLLKETSSTVSIPVIMLSACGDDVAKIKASRLYDEDYITKPVKAEELLERVEKVFGKRKGKV